MANWLIEVNPKLEHEEKLFILKCLREYNGLNVSSWETKESRHRVVIRDEHFKIVGYGAVDFLNWYRAETLHVFVVKEYRRQGIGKLINRILFRIAKRNGRFVLSCTVRKDNKPSIRMVEAVGFIQVGEFRNQRTGNTVLVFHKILREE